MIYKLLLKNIVSTLVSTSDLIWVFSWRLHVWIYNAFFRDVNSFTSKIREDPRRSSRVCAERERQPPFTQKKTSITEEYAKVKGNHNIKLFRFITQSHLVGPPRLALNLIWFKFGENIPRGVVFSEKHGKDFIAYGCSDPINVITVHSFFKFFFFLRKLFEFAK